MAAGGLPDETRSGRQILKDFVNGKLLHCERPPGCTLSHAQLGLQAQASPVQPQPQSAQRSSEVSASAAAPQLAHGGEDGATESASDGSDSAELGDSDEEAGFANGVESDAARDEAQATGSGAAVQLTDADRELMQNVSVGRRSVSCCWGHQPSVGVPKAPLAESQNLACVWWIQVRQTASPRDQSTSSRRRPLARKATEGKLMTQKHTMELHLPWAGVVAWSGYLLANEQQSLVC